VTEGDPPAVDVDVDGALAAVAGPTPVQLARIWATVDLDRTLASLGIEPGTAPAMRDALLGARVIVLPPGPDRASLAVAEPITEGRLAATLARHGEGPAGRYVAVLDGLGMTRDRANASGIAVSRVEDGPFGPSMLLLTGPVSGPHLILCEAAAVPSPP
jgi:hypothetical protein